MNSPKPLRRIHKSPEWPGVTPSVQAPEETVRAEAERQFGVGFDRASIGMALIALDGRILRVNDSFARLTGRTPDEVLTMRWQDVVVGEEQPTAEYFRAALAGGEHNTTADVCVRQASGESRDALAALSLVSDDSERALFFLAQLFDMTERRKLEEELREKWSWVRLLQAVAIAANTASTFQEAMRAAIEQVCVQTGWELGHVFTRSGDELLPTLIWYVSDTSRFASFMQESSAARFTKGSGLLGHVLQTGEPHLVEDLGSVEAFHRHESAGECGLQSGFAFPIKVEDEVVAVMEFYSTRRVTPGHSLIEVMEHIGTLLGQAGEHRIIEEALVENEERTRRIIETASDAFIEMNIDGLITDWNRQAIQIFGWEREEAIGRAVADTVIPERYRAAHNEGLRNFLQSGDGPVIGQRIELQGLRKDGSELPVELMVWPTSVGDSQRFNAFIRDISERKQAEAALTRANEEMRRSIDELERRNREITALNEMAEMLHSCMTAEEAHAVIQQFGDRLFPSTSGSLAVLTAGNTVVREVSRWGKEDATLETFTTDECWALRRGRVHAVDDPRAGLRCGHVTKEMRASYVCVPMMAQGETLGILHLHADGDAPESVTETTRQLANTVAEQISMGLANFRLLETRESLRFQSIRDPLTNLFNRRYMEESLDRELRRAARSGRPLGIIMLDIDHFKEINDTRGHDAGDQVLRGIGRFLQSKIRGEDIACRYGGEEFMLILPEASLETTAARARSLWEELRVLEVSFQGESLRSPTASYGVAVFPDHGSSRQGVVRAADAALYRAKATGRARVVTADEAL